MMKRKKVRSLPLALALAAMCTGSVFAAETRMTIGYLKVETPAPPTLSNLDPIPDDIGVAGARTGLQDLSLIHI